LKETSKVFSKKFACSSSITEADTIEMTGDLVYDMIEFLAEKYKVIFS
jgi:translation initiation factor 1 (eIF-1/SUI1)